MQKSLSLQKKELHQLQQAKLLPSNITGQGLEQEMARYGPLRMHSLQWRKL